MNPTETVEVKEWLTFETADTLAQKVNALLHGKSYNVHISATDKLGLNSCIGTFCTRLNTIMLYNESNGVRIFSFNDSSFTYKLSAHPNVGSNTAGIPLFTFTPKSLNITFEHADGVKTEWHFEIN